MAYRLRGKCPAGTLAPGKKSHHGLAKGESSGPVPDTWVQENRNASLNHSILRGINLLVFNSHIASITRPLSCELSQSHGLSVTPSLSPMHSLVITHVVLDSGDVGDIELHPVNTATGRITDERPGTVIIFLHQ